VMIPRKVVVVWWWAETRVDDATSEPAFFPCDVTPISRRPMGPTYFTCDATDCQAEPLGLT
jgi:hypothetical protein